MKRRTGKQGTFSARESVSKVKQKIKKKKEEREEQFQKVVLSRTKKKGKTKC